MFNAKIGEPLKENNSIRSLLNINLWRELLLIFPTLIPIQ